MINLKPILFFSLIELLAALAIGAGVLFWKWRRLKKERQAMEKLWHDAKDSTEASLAELEHQRETGGSAIAHKIKCLRTLKAMLDQELMAGFSQWERTREAVMLALGQMDLENEASKAQKIILELESESVLPEVDDYLLAPTNYPEMESLVDEQHIRIIELQQYNSDLTDLISKFRQLDAANNKLSDELKNVASTDEKSHDLQKLLDIFQKHRQEMQSMIVKFERESNQIGVKVKALEVHNQQLLTRLNSYRIPMGNTYEDSSMELKDEIDELKKNIERRDKTISRLYDKYEVLRREYMLLYDLPNKGKRPTLPPIAK
jgi:chromosome segregation ATPase